MDEIPNALKYDVNQSRILHASTCRQVLQTAAEQVAANQNEKGICYVLPHPFANAAILLLAGPGASEAVTAALTAFEVVNADTPESATEVDHVSTRFAMLEHEEAGENPYLPEEYKRAIEAFSADGHSG